MRYFCLRLQKSPLKRIITVFLLVFVLCFEITNTESALASETAGEALEIKSPSAILADSATGTILYEKNSHEKRPMASVTKIMTMLLAMEAIDSGKMSYDDMITGSAYAKSMGGSTIFLEEGEQLTVRDILKGIAVSSGNDAAVAMAEHISGSEKAFVAKMNERAAQLGMTNTNFINCNGLDADDHYSSSYDIMLMSRELMKHPDIHTFTTIWMDSLRDGKFTLSNTNKLVRFYEGATGLKTGSTSNALFCVSATAKRDDLHLIAVVMGAPTSKERNSDASSLLNYGFANYSIKKVTEEGEVVMNHPVSKGVKAETALTAKAPFGVLVKKGENPDVSKNVVFTSDFTAPITKDDVAGVVEYYRNGEKIGEGEIVFSEDIEKCGFFDVFTGMFRYWASGCTSAR